MILKLPLLLLFFGISCAIATPNRTNRPRGNKHRLVAQEGQLHGQVVNNPNQEPKGPPKPYIFSYGVHGDRQGGNFGQHEESDGKTVKGAYVVNLPDGRQQVVSYTAGKDGFQADVKYVGEAQYPVVTHKQGNQATQNELIKGEHSNQHHQPHQAQPSHANQQNHKENSQPANTQHRNMASFQNYNQFIPNHQGHKEDNSNVHHPQPQNNVHQTSGNRGGNHHARQQDTNSHPNVHGDLHRIISPKNHGSHPHQGHHTIQTNRNDEQASPNRHEVNHPHQGINQSPRKTNQRNHHNEHSNQGDQNSYDHHRHNNNNNKNNNYKNQPHHNHRQYEQDRSPDVHHDYEQQHRGNHDRASDREDDNRYNQAEGTHVKGNSDTQNDGRNKNEHINDNDRRHEGHRDHTHRHEEDHNHHNNNNNNDNHNEQRHRQNEHEENNKGHRQDEGHGNFENENHGHNHGDGHGQEHDQGHEHDHGPNHGNRNDFGDASDRKEQKSDGNEQNFEDNKDGEFNNDFFKAPEGFGSDKF